MAKISSYPHTVPTTGDSILISKSSNKTTRSTTVGDVIDLIETGLLPGVGTVTSIGVTAPSAFTVTNSPVTSVGTIAITGAGTANQYIDGTGSLQDSANQALDTTSNVTFSTITGDGAAITNIDKYTTSYIDTNIYTKTEADSLFTSGFVGAITPTSTAPTQDGLYSCSTSGTYTNFGGEVVSLNSQVVSIAVENNQTTFTQLVTPTGITFDSVPTLGSTNAVESGGVADSLDLKADIQLSKNLFNINNKIDNYYVKYQDGTLVSNNSFIVVTVNNLLPNTDYVYSNQGVISPSGVSALQQMAFFDANGVFVSGNIGAVNQVSFNTSSNIVTAKFTIATSRLDYQYQLEIGTSRGYYEEYSKNISNSTLDESLQKTLRNYTKEVVTFSSTDYTKNYTNLRTALESCTDATKEYEVWLYSSVSNVLTEYFTEAEINDSLFKGLDIPNNVTLVNPDLTTEITLGGSLDLATYNSTTRNRVSTLNFIYNGGIKGINVTAENIRYAVHDDVSSDKVNAIRIIEDCEFTKIGTEGYTQAYGAGTRSGMYFLMKNSKCFTDDEGAAFSNHNNTSFTSPCKIVLENNHFESVKGYNSVAFGSLGSGQDDVIEMRGNFLTSGIRLYEEGATIGIDFKLSGYGNSKVPVYIEQTDSVQYTYNFNEDVEIYRNRAGSTITRGKLVRLNYSGTGGVFAMSSSTPNQEYGIAFEDISTLELGKVKPFKSGQWIAISDTDLTGTAIGDRIGIATNGTLEITTSSEYIGVVLLNNFIRLK